VNLKKTADVVIVGAGHNGLVCAVLLAKAGLDVVVVEEQAVVGGATRTERPFARAPGLGQSTGAYLLGLMPPEVMAATGITVKTIRRDPHYFLPTYGQGGKHLLLGSDAKANRQMLESFFSAADALANERLDLELEQLREDLGPSWLAEPLSIEATAERYVRPALRQIFIDLCRKSVGEYLDRFGFQSDLIKAMYAVTDGFSGMFGTWDTPGTGMNFLVHNMCRLPGGGGTWMVVEGGMGTVSRTLALHARAHGAHIATSAPVTKILVEQGTTRGVVLADGHEIRANVVISNADPFRMRDLAGAAAFPAAYNARIDSYARPGTTLKLNLALSGLPRFSCLPEPVGQHRATAHLLPQEADCGGDIIGGLKKAFAQVKDGQLPDFPTIEWYIHTTVDPTLQDEAGHHSSALFVQWVPNRPAGTTWDAAAPGYAKHLLSICDRFAPGTSDLVVDTYCLHPEAIERHFGMTRGHIHHVDNGFGFVDRLPYAQPVAGLYSCSAGTHPAGAVIGCGGYNAANRVLKDLGKAQA
jgi:phytoene dehydrogenase-like protein